MGLVPQDFSILLFADTVADECATADRDAGLAPGTALAELRALVPTVDAARHPRDLSEGQRLGLALSVVLARAPGCCAWTSRRGDSTTGPRPAWCRSCAGWPGRAGRSLLATHDVELVAEVADRVVLLSDGEVVDDGPVRRVVCSSPVFAPRCARVLAPAEWLTVAEVGTALAGSTP